MKRRLRSVLNYLRSNHRRYKKSFGAGTRKAHFYIIVGYLISIPFSLRPGPSEVGTAIILASVIFAVHEYMGQRIQRLFRVLSCRYDYFTNLFNSHHGFRFGTIVAVDLLLAAPLIISNAAADLVTKYFLIFGMFVLLWYVVGSVLQDYAQVVKHIYYSDYKSTIFGIFIISFGYFIWHAILFRPESLTLAEVVSVSQCPTTFWLGCFAYMISALVVMLILLLVVLTVLAIMIATFSILIILSILFFPSLFWPQSTEIAPVWRLWISIAILTVLSIVYIPNTLSALDYIRNGE